MVTICNITYKFIVVLEFFKKHTKLIQTQDILYNHTYIKQQWTMIMDFTVI